MSRDDDHGIRPALRNVWATYTFLRDWDAGIDARHVTSRFGNAANTVSAPGYALYGAYVSYRVRPDASITTRIRNLTDEVYARSITGTPMYFLGAPRTIELALRVGF